MHGWPVQIDETSSVHEMPSSELSVAFDSSWELHVLLTIALKLDQHVKNRDQGNNNLDNTILRIPSFYGQCLPSFHTLKTVATVSICFFGTNKQSMYNAKSVQTWACATDKQYFLTACTTHARFPD